MVKKKVILSPKRTAKPTKFRFKGKIRLGFRKNKVVEIVKFN